MQLAARTLGLHGAASHGCSVVTACRGKRTASHTVGRIQICMENPNTSLFQPLQFCNVSGYKGGGKELRKTKMRGRKGGRGKNGDVKGEAELEG